MSVICKRNDSYIEIKRPIWYPPELIPRPLTITPETKHISVPKKVLEEADIDLSREIFGKWVTEDNIIKLILSYKKEKNFQRLARMEPTPCRIVYLPKKLGNINGQYVWKVESKNVLRLQKINNRVKIIKYIGDCNLESNKLIIPRPINAQRCILGVSDEFIVLIPNDLYGLKVKSNNMVDLRPVLPRLKKRGLYYNLGDCWIGEIHSDLINFNKIQAENICLILFPKTTECR